MHAPLALSGVSASAREHLPLVLASAASEEGDGDGRLALIAVKWNITCAAWNRHMYWKVGFENYYD
jgi:hypothetical protein